jgi:hypothetical protein
VNRNLKLLLLTLALIATAVGIIVIAASDSPTESHEASESTQSSCPRHADIEEARHQQPRGRGDALVPLHPRAVLMCRYFGYPFRHGGEGRIDQLAAHRILRSGRAAERMALTFDKSERLKPALEHGPVACPSDTGAWLFALFQYAEEPSVRVVVPLSGCQFVFSNAAAHLYFLSGEMKRQLLAGLASVEPR